MTEWSLEPIWNHRGLVALLSCLLLVPLLFGPRFGKLTWPRKACLTSLRVVVILLMVLAMLRPTHVFTSSKPRPSVLLVLFDLSRSMLLPDRVGGSSRWEAQQQALATIQASLPQLEQQSRIRLYGYDTELQTPEISAGKMTLPTKPLGDQTDIGTTLEEALRRETGQRLAGVILLGDGTQTNFNAPVESTAAARRLREEFGAPLFTTVFGPVGDAAQAKDVAIERLDEQYTVFVKNEVVIRGRVKIAGYVNQPIPLTAKLTNLNNKTEILGEQPKIARVDGESLEFTFPYMPQEAGHYKITVQAAEQPGELVTKNNILSAYLHVLEGGLRVLLIDSGKRLEYKFLRRALNDSPDIEVDEFLIDAANRKSWPVNLQPVLNDNKYDVLLLGNLPAQAITEESQRQIASLIEKGRGVMILGGLRAFGAGNYYNTPLAEMLPIVFDRFEKQEFASADRADLFLNGPLPMTPSEPHSVVRLADPAENANTWQRLPPLDFANRFTGVKKTPGVKVLLSGPKQEPLLVSSEYGNGRVLSFAGESTYRWPLRGYAAQHKRFWRQSILWLARRDESQQSDVWIKLAQRRYQPNSNVSFTLGARTPEGDALPQAQFTVTLLSPGGNKQTVRIVPGQEHWSGAVNVKLPGDYALEVTATLEGRSLGKTRAEFFVFDQDVELANSSADHEHFARLSQITKEFGGRTVPPEALPQLLSEIASRPPDLEIHQEKWRLGDSPLSSWLWLTSFALALTGEWWLRKRWGLV
jgi:uncharacterized membrane protein